MSITDELRAWGDSRAMESTRNVIHTIADRIDAEHEKARQDLIDANNQSSIRLPVDADGKAIRVGDTLDGYGQTTVVKGLALGDDGWSMTCENGPWFNFAAFTHHHEPTVEDVLREFALAICKDEALTIRKDVLDKCAAKLRLADDGKEL